VRAAALAAGLGLGACRSGAQALLVVEIAGTAPEVPPLAQLRVQAAGIERTESGEVPQQIGIYLPAGFGGEVAAQVEGRDARGTTVARGRAGPVRIAPGEIRRLSVTLDGVGSVVPPPVGDPLDAGSDEPADMAPRRDGSPPDAGARDRPVDGPTAVPDTGGVRDTAVAGGPELGPDELPGRDCLRHGEDKLILKIQRDNQTVLDIQSVAGIDCNSRRYEEKTGEEPLLDISWYRSSNPYRSIGIRVYAPVGALGTFKPFGVYIGKEDGNNSWSGAVCTLTLTTNEKTGIEPWGASSVVEVFKLAGSVTCLGLNEGGYLSDDKLEQFEFVTKARRW
jgi:hypothetical protein